MTIVVDDLKGISKIWILGDNFIAESFRKNFKKASADLFMRNNYEVIAHCSSKYSDKNINTLSCIVNSFIHAMNTKFYLPDFLIVFLDSDLIDYLQYKKLNTAQLLGPWIEYLTEFIDESLQNRHQLLPAKVRLSTPTQVYWVEALGHSNFDYMDKQAREIFNQCMDAACKLHEPMRVLKLREYWDKSNDNLVINNRFTKQGLASYWKSLDASFQFNL